MLTILIVSFVAILAINILVYLWAYASQSDKLTDITYSLCFILLGIYLVLRLEKIELGHLLAIGMVILWALRLGSFLFYRIHKMGQDERFTAFRGNWLGFLKFWILQSVSIWIIALPVIFFTLKSQVTFSLTGMLIWAIGWIIEATADYQKFSFKQKHPDKLMTQGLYSYVRHPNYTGEIMVWVGIFIFVSPSLVGAEWLSIVSPIWITILLIFISGIPLIRESWEKRYGNSKAYQEYINNTNALLPGIY